MVDILLVTDVPWVVNEVRAALSDPGYSISVVDDPRAVVDAVGEHTPDVLLVDLQIGSMGGMAVTRAVRGAAATSGSERPAVILLLDREADAFLAGRSGADAWILKPLSADEARSTIDAAINAEAVEAS